MWTLFEPVHAVTYFAPEALEAWKTAGLRGFWRGYFAGRAAPLAAGPEAVTASFYNFAPAFVARALPSVWELIPPESALTVRREGAVAALSGLLAGQEDQVKTAVGLLEQALDGLGYPGRLLAAANGAVGQGGNAGTGPAGDDLGRLWQAATTLREHRGDGHFAAALAADLDGTEVLALRCGLDMARETMQPIRGWSDEQWDAARERLAGRGLLDQAGTITAAGRDVHAAVEEATDRAAERPWANLGQAGLAELTAALTPLAVACAAVVPYPSPIGVPEPGK
jgi:helix-turn-helix protein